MPLLHLPRSPGACTPSLPHSGQDRLRGVSGTYCRPRLPWPRQTGLFPLGRGYSNLSVLYSGLVPQEHSVQGGQGPTPAQPFPSGAQKIGSIVQTQYLGLQQVRRWRPGDPRKERTPSEPVSSPTGPAGGIKPVNSTGTQQVPFLSRRNDPTRPLLSTPLCSCKFICTGQVPEC